MAATSIQQQRELTQAFGSFHQISEQLIHSYEALEQQVEHLATALRASQRERKAQTEKTQQVESRLQVLLNAMPAGVVVIDGAGHVQDCNSAALELLGEPLRFALWRDVIARSFAPRPDDGHDISLVSGRRVNLSTNAIGDEPGQIVLLSDVTETRALQEKLHGYERLAAMGDMASALAHQIRTPLSSAMLYAGHLKHSAHSGGELADKILSRLRHMEGLVRDMLLLARAESGAGEDVYVSDVVNAIFEENQYVARERQVTLLLRDAGRGYVIRAQRDLLASAIQNLINNALQSVSEHGRVEIRVHARDASWLDIEIVDTGCGIAAENLARLGEPFFTTRAQGHGLGLAVVNSVAKIHRGELLIASEVGVGSRFTLRLPVIRIDQTRST